LLNKPSKQVPNNNRIHMSQFQYSLISDGKLYRQPLEEVARGAELAGISYFQLREKDLTPAELLRLANKIRPILKRTKFIVNGQTDVAIASAADGVHLQRDNLPVDSVRSAFPSLLIGYSAHSPEEIKSAESMGADYVFISPVFRTQSKTHLLNPIGVDQLKKWVSNSRIPVFALGGVTADKLDELRDSGSAGAASISLFIDQGEFAAKGMVIR
jgi:thiamine-phosphate pyrophosphorylase